MNLRKEWNVKNSEANIGVTVMLIPMETLTFPTIQLKYKHNQVQIEQHILICTWQIHFSLTYQLTKSMAPASEDLSPYSQQTATCPYTEPTESTLHPPANLPNIHFDPIFSSMPRTSDLTFFHGLSHQSLVHISLLSYAPPTTFSTILSA
jgi:hypothetical protein